MPRPDRCRLAAAAIAVALGAASLVLPAAAWPASTITTTGLTPGQIKHVWLIVLDDKSFDAAFTGLNHNDYLWQTLRKQGVLLKQYYATSHYAMSDYISMVSGQGPEPDTQNDCAGPASNLGSDDAISLNQTNGIVTTPGVNYGQVISRPGPNSPETGSSATTNGCVYPSNVATLFDQLSAAGVSWKGYAQDLGNVPAREQVDGCGYPGGPTNNSDTNPTNLAQPPDGITSYIQPQADDQYVASHFPFAWFHSLTGEDCDSDHIANLDSAASGLFHDLQSESTTPAFSWISPNDCSNSHQQVCVGNNLSGAFNADGSPNYEPSGQPGYQPGLTSPTSYTGGLYAADLFLAYYVPLIEASPAFADGGLIDITFDEAAPPFTYSGNSFNNAADYKRTSADQPNWTQGLAADLAGENIAGRNYHYEPTGPMTPLRTDGSGRQLYPGPGFNAYVNRPAGCSREALSGCLIGGGGTSPGQATHVVDGEAGSPTIVDDAITALDRGRLVTDTVDLPSPWGSAQVFVGPVSNSGPLLASSPSGRAVRSSFQLVDAGGNPVTLSGRATQITLSAEEPVNTPGINADGRTADPLFDPYNPTPGGGRTGSLLIGPSIRPNTASTIRYNHYSWLRTMEDIFGVVNGSGTQPLTAGTVSGGIDARGHLGFAAQPGLWPFGPDVFSNEHHPAPPPALPPPHPDLLVADG